MSIYPTELVAKSEFELRIFERVSQETGKQLLDEVKRLREALNQPAAPEPDGWQLVPIEPTEEMLQAALKVATPGALRAAWARMLAAATEQKS